MVFQSNPIFIGGDGRSGTTLLSLILDSHPKLSFGPELHFRGPKNLGSYILNCLNLRDQIENIDRWLELKNNPDLYHGINFVNRCHRFGVNSSELRVMIKKEMKKLNSLLETFEDRCHLINTIGEFNCGKKKASRWGIKIMRDIKILQKYIHAWPNAQFLHIIRDGRDVVASQMIEHSTWGYSNIEEAAKGWVDIIKKSRKYAKFYPLLEVRYEDLVTQPKATIQRILKFLGIPWHDDLLRHHEVNHTLYKNPYNHPSIDTIVRPINNSAVGRYRNDLTLDQIQTFNCIAGKHLIELSYTVDT